VSDPVPPDEEAPLGAKYCLRSTGAGRGEIYDSEGKVLWTYEPPESPWNVLNGPLRGPDLILRSPDGVEHLRIRRERTFPLSRFAIDVGGSPAGAIENLSLLSVYYTVELPGRRRWVFRIPAFTANFNGKADDGASVRVRIASELVWYAHVDEGNDCPELVASLALIHSERCRW